jgi:hypothetical protein
MTRRSCARETSEHASIFGTEHLAFLKSSIIKRLQVIDISHLKSATRAALASVAGLGTAMRKLGLRFPNSAYQACAEGQIAAEIRHRSAPALVGAFVKPVEFSSRSSVPRWESILFLRSVRDFVHSTERVARTGYTPLPFNRISHSSLADPFTSMNLHMYCCHLVRRRRAKRQCVCVAKPIPGTRVALVES